MLPSEYLLEPHQRGTRQTQTWLREALAHLDDDLFQHRFNSAARFAGLSMSGHARQKGAFFRGKAADAFINMLADMMAGLLAAEVSAETRAALGR